MRLGALIKMTPELLTLPFGNGTVLEAQSNNRPYELVNIYNASYGVFDITRFPLDVSD